MRFKLIQLANPCVIFWIMVVGFLIALIAIQSKNFELHPNNQTLLSVEFEIIEKFKTATLVGFASLRNT